MLSLFVDNFNEQEDDDIVEDKGKDKTEEIEDEDDIVFEEIGASKDKDDEDDESLSFKRDLEDSNI